MSAPKVSGDSDRISDHKKPNWKPLMVLTLKATETLLDGLPIPAARGCISIILKVIEANDVAAENEDVLKELQARYEDLADFLRSLITTEIPASILQDAVAFGKQLGKLAKHWEPRLTKSRKWGYFMKLFGAHSERDALNKFVNKLNQVINDFLLRIEVRSRLLNYREHVKTQHAVTLSSMPHAPHASYKSARANGAPTCLPGTRKSVLAAIKNWALHANDPGYPPIFWLNGLAGIGKTTIARTVAAYLDAEQRLGGSFVFLRTDDQLKDGNLLFPTLALQLSSMFPDFRARLAQEVDRYPSCVTQPPSVQFERLIRRPLSDVSLTEPLILILDALDECQPDSLAEEILCVLMDVITDIPFLRIFITSRPEGHIREALGLGMDDSCRQTLVLHQDMDVQTEVEGDIRLFLRTRLQEIWDKDATNQTGTIWPGEEDLETLVQQCGRLFIYAATAVRFIGGNRSLNLEMQLQNLLKIEKNHIPSGEVEPYVHLDQLYLNILKTAFAGITDTKGQYYRVRFQNIVGSIVLMQRPLPLGALARFLHKYTVDDIKQTLYYLHSIFVVPDKILSGVPRIYHLSFPNFITHSDRCTNNNAYINPQSQEKYLFLRCLATMERHFGGAVELEQPNGAQKKTADPTDDEDENEHTNTDHSSSFASSLEADDTKSEPGDDFYDTDIFMTAEAKYSCDHWSSHLVNIESGDTETTKYLARFIKHYFSQWLEKRVNRMSSATFTRKIKLAKDTFDIMHDVHRWAAAGPEAANSRRNRAIRKAIRRSARKAYQTLFPRSAKGYRFGNRIHSSRVLADYPAAHGGPSPASVYSAANVEADDDNGSGTDWASSASGGAYSR